MDDLRAVWNDMTVDDFHQVSNSYFRHVHSETNARGNRTRNGGSVSMAQRYFSGCWKQSNHANKRNGYQLSLSSQSSNNEISRVTQNSSDSPQAKSGQGLTSLKNHRLIKTVHHPLETSDAAPGVDDSIAEEFDTTSKDCTSSVSV